MSATLLDLLAAELNELLEPLADAVEDPFWLDGLLAQLGVLSSGVGEDALVAALRAVVDLKQQISSLAANPSPSFAGTAHLLESAKQAFIALRAVSSGGGPAAALEGLGEDLVQLLLSLYLSTEHPLLFRLGVLLTLIESVEEADPTPAVVVDGKVLRQEVVLCRFHPERLVDLVRDPAAVLRAEYLNSLATVDDANAMADKLFGRLSRLLTVLGVPWSYGLSPENREALGDQAALADHTLTIFIADRAAGAAVDAGISLKLSSADQGDLGLVVGPFGALTITKKAGSWALEFDLTAGIDAFAYGRHGFTLMASASVAEVAGLASATLAAPGPGPALVFGALDGTRLEIGGALLKLETTLSEARQELTVSVAVSSSAIVIAPGDGDGFLQSVLPKEGLQAKFDLGLAWSNETGFSFHGAAGLDATLPVGISLGGVLKVPTLHLGLQAGDAGLQVEVSASVGLSIGPVQALVDRIGLLTVLTFPKNGGNLGVADLALGFKPPSGVGLVVDSAGVSGGGFLKFEPEKHEYSGVLQLEFNQLALQAFGLITTQVAGGQGYSLLALIDADFPPVQLGWGFTLDGVGGLLAIHRTASVDALRAALKADKLSTILFPKDAIANAPQILAALDAYFPTAPGRFLFGPMALIGWGTPTVLTAAIAVVVELPEPIRILLLARVAARLPSPAAPLVRINMDALGVLDLGQSSLSLDATLFDSRLLSFVISGDMALRATWAGQREFLLAVGGFHPRFTPPAGFPALQRITIDMPSGIVSKLRLAAYLAITSNTVQFGAELDVFIGVSGFGLAGHLGFDALLQLDPFHFDADISGSVALTAGGDDLMSVGLDATLSGPAPWNIAGKFKIHLLFFDVHKSFSHSWGEDAPALDTAAVDVGQLLNTALADPRSWAAQLPAGAPAQVSVRGIEDPTAVLAHPLARLEVHERTVPLGLDITRFGGAAPAGATRFAITGLRIGAAAVPSDPVEDDFAPAQFFELSDEEKLARPSFERHDAGVRLGAVPVASGSSVHKDIAYETFYIDELGGAQRTDPPAGLWLIDLQAIREVGSAARAASTRTANRRYQMPSNQALGSPIRIQEPAFVVVDADTLAPVGPAAGTVYSEAQALLNGELARDPGRRGALQIVATHEMAGA
jgi:hypothetical protein